MASGDRHAPEPLSEAERAALFGPPREGAPAHVAGDYPPWLDGAFARVFGEGRSDELAALTERAPVDLRVNTLKADRAKVLRELERFGAQPCPIAATGVRIAHPPGASRAPNIEVEAAFQKGWIELQDEGSQIVAALTGGEPGEQVADICAGGGGKTLALAAMMENKGQLYAWDSDRHRLAPIFQRLERAGVRNAQVKRGGDERELDALEGHMDCVVLDVPCTGTGAWRRRPDAKWRLKEKALQDRINDQDAILQRAAHLVKSGGRIAYITCSLLAEENEDRIDAFLRTPAGAGFSVRDLAPLWRSRFGSQPPQKPPGVAGRPGLRLSPRATGTDGFLYACWNGHRRYRAAGRSHS